MNGILFKSQMIPQIVNGIKTVTRRLINPQPVSHGDGWWSHQGKGVTTSFQEGKQTPEMKALARYKVGETVYTKEVWAVDKLWDDKKPSEINHNATVYYFLDAAKKPEWVGRKRSPLIMPAWAARYFIKIIDVRAERLQKITEEDCLKEGIPGYTFSRGCCSNNPPDPRWKYIELWDSINPKHPWTNNDYVFRYEFIYINERQLSKKS